MKEQIAWGHCKISTTGGPEERVAAAPSRAGGIEPASGLALKCSFPSTCLQAPAMGGSSVLTASMGTWAPPGAFQGCMGKKGEALYEFLQSSGFLRATLLFFLQACSPTTRTRSAIGSAALNATTIRNSGSWEPYPFLAAGMF